MIRKRGTSQGHKSYPIIQYMMGRGPDDDIAARNFHQGECQIGSRQSEEEIYKWSLVDISSMDSINREAMIKEFLPRIQNTTEGKE